MAKKLWQKESTTPEDWVLDFTVGDDYLWDTLLIPYDVTGTKAHAWGLSQLGLIGNEELVDIEAALDELNDASLRGEVHVSIEDEDVHTVLERWLTEKLGETGQKIHAGRSRNDQVLVALRLWLKDVLRAIGRETARTCRGLMAVAESNGELVLPGHTHLQQAMPSSVAAWALGYAELIAADLNLLQASFSAVDQCPWGSAAGYGVPYLDLPRQGVCDRLGFARLQTNVTSVQLSRGKIEAAVLHGVGQIAASINRLASDLVIYNSAEFGFVTLPQAFTTGSSIMPQKRNPDVLELIRATYHRILAEENLLKTLPSNLPSGYHRDLQLTKEAVMRGCMKAHGALVALNSALAGLTFDGPACRRALSSGTLATAEALKLVKEGIPFRQAYLKVAESLPDDAIPENVLETYLSIGYPGRPAVTEVESLLSQQSWIE